MCGRRSLQSQTGELRAFARRQGLGRRVDHRELLSLVTGVFPLCGMSASGADVMAIDDAPFDTVFEYDPEADVWSKKASMPTARGALAAAVVDGKVYAVGGVTGFGEDNVASLEVYDPRADAWTTKASMPTARDHLAVGVVGGKIYAIGGRFRHSFGSNIDVNEQYDTASDAWSISAPLPTTRSGIGSAVLGGLIYVFGGEAPSGTFDENEAYDPATDSWTRLPTMPTARHGLGAIVVDGVIYVVGGGVSPGSADSDANEAFEP